MKIYSFPSFKQTYIQLTTCPNTFVADSRFCSEVETEPLFFGVGFVKHSDVTLQKIGCSLRYDFVRLALPDQSPSYGALSRTKNPYIVLGLNSNNYIFTSLFFRKSWIFDAFTHIFGCAIYLLPFCRKNFSTDMFLIL